MVSMGLESQCWFVLGSLIIYLRYIVKGDISECSVDLAEDLNFRYLAFFPPLYYICHFSVEIKT